MNACFHIPSVKCPNCSQAVNDMKPLDIRTTTGSAKSPSEPPINTIESILLKYSTKIWRTQKDFQNAVADINHLITQARWEGHVGESAWWHKNYKRPEYAELLERRHQKMKEHLNDLERLQNEQ